MTKEQAEELVTKFGVRVYFSPVRNKKTGMFENLHRHVWLCGYCKEWSPFDWDVTNITHTQTCMIPEAETILCPEGDRSCLPETFWIGNSPNYKYGGCPPFCCRCGIHPIQGGPGVEEKNILCGECLDAYSDFVVGNHGTGGHVAYWIGWNKHDEIEAAVKRIIELGLSPLTDPATAILYSSLRLPCPLEGKGYPHNSNFRYCDKYYSEDHRAKGEKS